MISKLKAFFERILVRNWKDSWKWMSVHFATLLIGLSYLQDYYPEMALYLPERWARYLGMTILVARLLKGWRMKDVPICPKQ